MNKHLLFRAKKILGGYLSELSYPEHNAIKTEELLLDACPDLLKKHSALESSCICALAFDLINYLEWNRGHYLAQEITLKLCTLTTFYKLEHKVKNPLNTDLIKHVNQFLFTHENIDHLYKNTESLAVNLCLCALMTAYREQLNSQKQPTQGPNVRLYRLHQAKKNAQENTKNLFFKIHHKNIPQSNYLLITKEKIKTLFEDEHQLEEQIEQTVTPFEILRILSKANDLQANIQALKLYVIQHQVVLNPRVKSSLTKLEQATTDAYARIKIKLKTTNNKLPSVKHKVMYAAPYKPI